MRVACRPGQYLTDDFPVLSAGPTPHTPLEEWTFAVVSGEERKTWTWNEFRALPSETMTVDIHCVTRWSKLDTTWEGVSVDTLLADVEHDAPYLLASCDGGYTTNLPLEDVTMEGVGRLRLRRRATRVRARRSCPLARPPPVPLEEREVGAWLGAARRGRARLLGDVRLPHVRRSVAGTALRGRLTWQLATVDKLVQETARVKTIVFGASDWAGHLAGQHLDIRLTAEDGYRAEREYSIASAPGEPAAITVERLDDGEVSPYLTEELRVGDEIELRGPVGGYFVWDPEEGGPLLLVAGGSGIVPLRAMIRAREGSRSDVDTRLLFSSRGWDDIIYRDELDRLTGDGLLVVHTLTRSQPVGWDGYARRVDDEMLTALGPDPTALPRVYVCGPTTFVEAVAEALVGLGHEPQAIKTERFGATGG